MMPATRPSRGRRLTKSPSKKAANPIDKHVGMRVRQARLMRNVTQEVLAEGLGVTFQQIQKNENGSNRISAGRLLQIARKLRMPITFFFDGAPGVVGEVAADPVLEKFLATPDGVDLARAVMKMTDPGVRRRLVALATAMTEGRQ